MNTKQLSLNIKFYVMAFVEDIINNEKEIEEILQFEQECGYAQHITNNTSAVIIQRYNRGYYPRTHILKLISAAIIIKRHWKRYITRK